jgi:hypothetical protein
MKAAEPCNGPLDLMKALTRTLCNGAVTILSAW